MSITDLELRERLLALGYNSPPITDTSRNILQKKLRSLEIGSNMKPERNVDSVSYENENHEDLVDEGERSDRNFVPILNKVEKVKRNVWDRTGLLGTTVIIICSTFFMFYIFQLIGNWSDRRYRNLVPTDVKFPICEHFRVTNCVPESEAKFTESNLNIVKASLHHIILRDYCGKKRHDKISDSVGMYLSIKKEEVYEVLTKELDFSSADANTLIGNSIILFNLNPKWDVKVKNELFIYKNYRLLRSCGFMPWGEYVYAYSLYLFASFTVVLLTYKLNHWVRGDGGPEIERLMNDLLDILKQRKEKNVKFVIVEQARELLVSPEDQVRNPRLWGLVLKTIEKKQTEIYLKKEKVDGVELDVFCLK